MKSGNPNVLKPDMKSVTLKPGDLEKNTGTKLVFITASPVLTNEVMRFYTNLKNSLKGHVQQREDRRQARIQKQKQIEQEQKL